jgi:hypothetical protein
VAPYCGGLAYGEIRGAEEILPGEPASVMVAGISSAKEPPSQAARGAVRKRDNALLDIFIRLSLLIRPD